MTHLPFLTKLKNMITLPDAAMIAALLSVSVFLPNKQLLAGEQQWSYLPIVGYVDTSPAVADVDADGVQDIVLATTGGRVLVLDANGRMKWSTDANQTISNPPTLAGTPLRIYVISNPGAVVCLDAKTGVKMWRYNMADGFPWGMTALAAADIDGDGQAEIIAADKGGHLVCLGEDGAPIWTKNTKVSFNTAPALADLDGDGKSEILLGGEETPLVCFSNKGTERWRVKKAQAVNSSPLVYDLQNDGAVEILLGEGDGLSVYSNAGVQLWHHRMKSQVHDAISIGDVDLDGKKDIIVVDLLGQVACLSADGTLQWQADVGRRVRRSPAIGDIDGDGAQEVVIGGYSDALHIFDAQGNLKEQAPLHGGMNASPTLVDFHKNGRLSVVCATTADVAALSWISKKAGVEPEVQWAEYRMNSARTGSMIKETKIKHAQIAGVDYGLLHVGVNDYRVTVQNPQKQRLTLKMEISKNNSMPVAGELSSSDTTFSYRMPFSIIGQSAVNLQFNCMVMAGKKLISERRQAFYLIPFAKDAADLRRTIAEIENNAARLTDADDVPDQTTVLLLQSQMLEKKAKIAGTLSPLQRAELRSQFETAQDKATKLLAMTDAAVEATSALAAYAANPWAPFGGVDEIVEGRTRPADLRVEAFAGEIESAAVNLANFSGRAVVVLVQPEDLLDTDSTRVPFRQALEFHEALNVPTHSLDLSADALPKLGQARTVMIPAWSVRQLWLNIDAAKLTPGDWSTHIKFSTLGTDPQEAVASLSVKVWPVALNNKSRLRLCHWGYVSTSVLKDIPNAALDDQVEHGTNVFVATGAFFPAATFDENGDLVGDIDFKAHDEYVRRHSPFGIILFCGYQGRLKGPAEQLSPTWVKAYKQWIGAWVKHLLDMGLTYDDFAFYPVDEPGLHQGLVERVVALAKPIKEVDAKIKMYTDPVGQAGMADLKKMAPYIDIWCPNRNGYLLNEGGEKLDFIKSTGAAVWTYECEGDAKHQSPLGYYRAQSWLVWRHGLTGIGFWSYCTSSHDPWFVPRGGQDYLLIYQGDGVVTSKRWEAVRDGMEDYNVLMQLQTAVKNPVGVSPDIVRAAKHFLQHDAPAIGAYCGLDDDGTLPGVDGLSGAQRVEDRRWRAIQKARRRMAELLLALRAEK